MGIVCLAGIFAVFLLLAWTLCRAAGWEKEREESGTGAVPERVAGEKVEKNRKNLKISVDIWRVGCYTNKVGW